MTIQEKTRDLVQKGRIGESIDYLLQELSPSNYFYDEVILLSSQWKSSSRTKRVGVEGKDGIRVVENGVAEKILSLLKEMDPPEIPATSPPKEKTVRIELVIDGDYQDFSEEQKNKLWSLLAMNLEMGVEEIKIRPPRKGSIIVPIDLPAEKAELLMKLIKDGALSEAGITSYNQVFEKEGNKVTFLGDPPYQLAFADLKWADLRRANLLGSNLLLADLQWANLQGAYLQRAYLQRANLRLANLQEAYLQGAGLQEACLQEANLWSAYLQEANLRSANLQSANLQWAYLKRVDLQGADLRGADLRGVKLKEANMQEALLLRSVAFESQRKELLENKADISGVIFVPESGESVYQPS